MADTTDRALEDGGPSHESDADAWRETAERGEEERGKRRGGTRREEGPAERAGDATRGGRTTSQGAFESAVDGGRDETKGKS